MDRIQKSSNSYPALMRREMGLSGRRLPQSLFTQRFFANLAQDKHVDAVYKKSHRKQIYQLHLQYPLVLTCGNKTIKLWNLEKGKCQWKVRIARLIDCYVMQFVENRVVCVGKLVDFGNERIWVFHRDTGERIAEYIHHELSRGNFLCGQQRDCFIAEAGEIWRYSLDTGKVIQKIDSQGFVDKWSFNAVVCNEFGSHLASSKDFLLHLFQWGVVVHDLNKKNKYQIDFDFTGRRIERVLFEGTHCLCVMEWKDVKDWKEVAEGVFSRFDYYVFDFEKKVATSIYKSAIDDPSLEWALSSYLPTVLHKEWVYLGYSSGHVVAVNWVTHAWHVFGQQSGGVTHFQSVDFMSFQEGVLMTGSRARNDDQAGLLYFWDIRSFEQIGITTWPAPCIKPLLSNGRLLMGEGSSLVVRDFNQWMDGSSS